MQKSPAMLETWSRQDMHKFLLFGYHVHKLVISEKRIMSELK